MARKKKKRKTFDIGRSSEEFVRSLERSEPFGIRPTSDDMQSGLFGFFSRGRINVERADAIEKLRRKGRLF